MLGTSEMPSWVCDYIGVEFEEVGRGELCDCWGLVRKIYSEQFDIELPSYDQYENTKELERLAWLIERGRLSAEWHEIERGSERKADVVLFQIQGQLCHVGLCLGGANMIHIQLGKNSCIENYRGLRWSKRVFAFYRHEKFLQEGIA